TLRDPPAARGDARAGRAPRVQAVRVRRARANRPGACPTPPVPDRRAAQPPPGDARGNGARGTAPLPPGGSPTTAPDAEPRVRVELRGARRHGRSHGPPRCGVAPAPGPRAKPRSAAVAEARQAAAALRRSRRPDSAPNAR